MGSPSVIRLIVVKAKIIAPVVTFHFPIVGIIREEESTVIVWLLGRTTTQAESDRYESNYLCRQTPHSLTPHTLQEFRSAKP